MKKLFLLIPALVLTIAMYAKEINVSSGTSNIIHYTIADSGTEDGDVLVLTDAGPYISTAGTDDYTKLVKNLTIKAADGIEPVVKLEVPFRSTGGKTVKFIGITFDGTSLTNYDFYFRFYDDADNNLEFEDCEFKNISKYIFDVYTGKKANSLKLTNCDLHDNSSRGILNRGTLTSLEINGGQIYNFTGYPVLDNYDGATLGDVNINGIEFYNNAKDIISGTATSHANSCTINNCYFHNNARSAVYFAASTVEGVETCDAVIVRNSTFANNDLSASSRSVIEVQNYGGTEAANIEVTVDHCTFYNNSTVNYDYSCVRSRKSTKVSISNSIFAYPSTIEFYATNCYGGTITNNLVYNLSKGHRSSGGAPAITNAITGDPLFADAANGNFSLAGDWTTMNISPARGAATDGSDLGDPRWHSTEVLPSTDFATPYAFVGAKAFVSDKMQLNGDNYIASTASGGSAYWKINITKACAVQVTLNMSDAVVTGHNYQVEIFDAENNSIGALNEGGWHNNTDDKTLTSSIQIPSAGNYKIVLTNNESGTTSVIKGITLTYIGGATINIPAEELVGEEAVIVDKGHKKVYKDADGNLQYDDNSTPLGEYVYWNINATKAGDMKVTLNVAAPEVGDASSHQFLVELYSDLNASPIASSAEASATSGTGARVLPDAINIPAAGNYIIKLTNQKQWSSAILHSIQFEYLGGATIAIPENALIGEEAVLVDEGHLKVSKLANGDLKYGDNGNPLDEYVYWNINATKAGLMNVTLNIIAPDEGSPSGHQFLVELYSDLSGTPIISTAEATSTSAIGAIVLPDMNIPATGNYIVKLTNQTQWSSAILRCIEIKYAGGAVVNVPGQILGEDALLYKTGSKYMIRTEEGYLKSSNNGDPTSEWAVWNIAATAGTMNVTLNLDPVTSSGHNYRVELYDGDVLKDYAEELASAELSDAVHSKGDVALEKKLVIPTDGNYTIKLINRTQWSSMILQGITFTAAPVLSNVTIDEAATDNSAWVANVDGAAVNVELTRTFTGGMYNTICLPFAVESDAVETAFGAGVELMYMTGATLDGTVLDLEFASTTSIYQGTPYLIKPVANVANPTFANVAFKVSDAVGSATGGTNADFIGTFVKTTILANVNNLYLQSGNVLMFSENDVTIKGTRAYFHVKVPSSSPVVRPRIVLNGQVLTDIELVNGEPQTNGKFIENGQLIIIRDGVRYNALGVRVK